MKSNRLSREQKTLLCMILLYCKKLHNRQDRLCEECESLHEYALARLNKCPYGNSKPTCKKCTTHCYKPEMREKIRQVMRYAGPRMLFKHPLLAVHHLIDSRDQQYIFNNK